MNNTQSTTTTVGQQTPVNQQPSMLNSMLPIFLIMIVFYFLMMRPQQKREAKKREMISNLKKGDRVVTLGGIIGIVHKIVNNEELSLEVSEGVNIRVLKTSIGDVLGKDSTLNKSTKVAEEKTSSKIKK